ncbi:MAG: mycothiol synthase [Frankiales bacterium]|nr:mycothiol synthase [Frankiales bacterium]
MAVTAPTVQSHLSAQDVDEVRALIEQVTAADGTPPLSEHVMLHLPGGGDSDVRHLLVRGPEGLVGYAHLDVTDQVAGSSAELAVHPRARGQGIGRALAEELMRQSPDGRLRLWAHGDHPAAGKLAASLHFERARSLWQLRRSLTDPLPDVVIPEGIAVRTFVVGRDEQAWTELNNRAFAAHPDQGGWGPEEVLVREAEPWFDAAGFFLAFRGSDLVGFHWTKIHGGTSHGEHAHDALGEVYIVGVDPTEQGHGLGPALTLLGLHHLQKCGLAEVMLYVDESNTAAIRVYERLGFTRHATDVYFAHTP